MLRRPPKSILSTPPLGTRYGNLQVSSIRRYAAQVPPRIVIKKDEIEESFLKGSGPGGQKIVRLRQ